MGAVGGLVEREEAQGSELTVDRPFPMFLICWQGAVLGLVGLAANAREAPPAKVSLERLCLRAAFVGVRPTWPVPRTLSGSSLVHRDIAAVIGQAWQKLLSSVFPLLDPIPSP